MTDNHDQLGHALAMVTAWISAAPDLLPAALPMTPTLQRIADQAPDSGIAEEYKTLINVSIELSLLCATAMSCWADSVGISREILIRDIALGQAAPVAEP